LRFFYRRALSAKKLFEALFDVNFNLEKKPGGNGRERDFPEAQTVDAARNPITVSSTEPPLLTMSHKSVL
jgi:hypothetical protein